MKHRSKPGTNHLASIKPSAGEIWLADLGLAAKVRPVLVLSYPEPDDARALAIVAPLTSQIRSARGEIDLGKPSWLPKASAVNLQGVASFNHRFLQRKLGRLSEQQIDRVKTGLRELLDL